MCSLIVYLIIFLGFGDAAPPGYPLVPHESSDVRQSQRPHLAPSCHRVTAVESSAAPMKVPAGDSGISCRTVTGRSRGSSAGRSASAGLDSFGAIESYKKLEILGEGSYATVFRGYSQ